MVEQYKGFAEQTMFFVTGDLEQWDEKRLFAQPLLQSCICINGWPVYTSLMRKVETICEVFIFLKHKRKEEVVQ